MSSGVRSVGVRGMMRGIRLIAFGSRIYVQVDFNCCYFVDYGIEMNGLRNLGYVCWAVSVVWT